MWEQEVIPRLSPYTGALIFTRVLHVWGLGDESAVEERLDSLLHSTDPTIATYARPDAIDMRITAKAETVERSESGRTRPAASHPWRRPLLPRRSA